MRSWRWRKMGFVAQHHLVDWGSNPQEANIVFCLCGGITLFLNWVWQVLHVTPNARTFFRSSGVLLGWGYYWDLSYEHRAYQYYIWWVWGLEKSQAKHWIRCQCLALWQIALPHAMNGINICSKSYSQYSICRDETFEMGRSVYRVVALVVAKRSRKPPHDRKITMKRLLKVRGVCHYSLKF